MMIDDSTSVIADAVASIEGVGSHIETTFAEVGGHLERGHSIFLDLNEGLATLSGELSGTKIEGAAAALQSVAAKLTGLADVLPQESVMLGAIGRSAVEASTVLRPLIKQIQMVMIIARSARIEAASLDANQASFLDFTQEAMGLAKAVKLSADACTGDQVRLAEAIDTALERQGEFEARYRAKLLSVSAELISAYSGIQSRQTASVHLTNATGANTRKMAEAVGNAIVSLQAGDSARQRLEHICQGLRVARTCDTSIVPSAALGGQAEMPTGLIVSQLQAAQLKSAAAEFGADIGDVGRSLAALQSGAVDIVGHGRSLYGGRDGDMGSFLVIVKQALMQASDLIRACEESRRLVDDALSIVDDALGSFRLAIVALSETIVDIILIGMNAGLRAGQLGVKGRAFVVIANELKATADSISGVAAMLKPILDVIERSAGDLKSLRGEGDMLQVADLETSILSAMQEIEAGSGQLTRLMERLVAEGTQFEKLMTTAITTLSALGEKSAALPGVARGLDLLGGTLKRLGVDEISAAEPVLNDLYAQYTMISERDVHAQFAKRAGLASVIAPVEAQTDDADDVLFF